jgi:epoxyqueuosine reductase QueG
MDTEMEEAGMELNRTWEQRIRDRGADFVYFVDISMLPAEIIEGYSCALLFGKRLSKEYLGTLRAGQAPEHKEVLNVERRMDALADRLAETLEAEGYKSIARLKSGRLPHKTVALRAGLGFIGKNNLLITKHYGCAVMLGKVLTTAPFAATGKRPKRPGCGDCHICVDVCPTGALLGKSWSLAATREEIMTRKLCTLCLKCMIWCPHTMEYMEKA